MKILCSSLFPKLKKGEEEIHETETCGEAWFILNMYRFSCIVFLVAYLIFSHAFRSFPVSSVTRQRAISQAQGARLYAADAPPAPVDDPYLVHYCVSCEYEYDEKKGYKKRLPPGTRMRDKETFMCPVCGAAIDQFKVKGPSP